MSRKKSWTGMFASESIPMPRRASAPAGYGAPPRESDLRAASQLPSRPTRNRASSHYNSFQTLASVLEDDGLSRYASLSRHGASGPHRHPSERAEKLPAYTCTVHTQARVWMNVESVNPLFPLGESDWIEAFAVLHGTQLSLHRVKDGGAGKLRKTYTLQHAEVGLASDVHRSVLIPQTRLAHFIPSAARKRAHHKDPAMFREIVHTVLRLRVEDHQLLFASADEELIHAMIYALSAAIDISQPLDDRSIPRQCTVPRRRRRGHGQQSSRSTQPADLTDPTLLAEQERIFRRMFPHLAAEAQQAQSVRTETDSTAPPLREDEEVDLYMIREEPDPTMLNRPQSSTGRERPSTSGRQATTDSVWEEDMMYATPATNFDTTGKWQPPHHRSPSQQQRYVRRCLPVLLAASPRASDIVISNGQRMKVNWHLERLEPWELQPPSYKAHKFSAGSPLEEDDEEDDVPPETQESNITRVDSQHSTSASSTQNGQQPVSSSELSRDKSSPAKPLSNNTTTATPTRTLNVLPRLRRAKSATGSSMKSEPHPTTLAAMASVDPKGRSPDQLAQDLQGAMLCF